MDCLKYEELLEELIAENDIIRSEDMKVAGIPLTYATRMVDKGKLVKLERGVYAVSYQYYDKYHLFQQKNQAAIFSFVSALYLHDLVDSYPYNIDVTVYSGYNTHRFPPIVKPHYIKKELHELGKIEVTTRMGNKVYCYDKERSICDLIANRKKVEADIFASSLRNYIKSNDKDIEMLKEYAVKMGIEDRVREMLKVLYYS